MKYTRKEVKGMFSRLCKALGKKEDAGSYSGWNLDYVACYGGYVIEELGPNGGCSHPYGTVRRSAKEMYLSMWMLAQQIENEAYQKQQMNKLEW